MTACFACWMCYDNCSAINGDRESADGQTDCTVLIIACRSFPNLPDNTARDGSIQIDEGNAWM